MLIIIVLLLCRERFMLLSKYVQGGNFQEYVHPVISPVTPLQRVVL